MEVVQQIILITILLKLDDKKTSELGERQRWWVGADCKSAALRLRGFESLLSHNTTVIVQWYTCKESERLHSKWEIAVQFRKQLGQTETFRGFTTVAYKWWKSVLLYGVFSTFPNHIACWDRKGFIVRGRAVVARQAHNLEVGGSNPSPATKLNSLLSSEAEQRPSITSQAVRRRFKSFRRDQYYLIFLQCTRNTYVYNLWV